MLCYRTMCGLQYHLNNYDHDSNPTPLGTPVKSHRKKGRGGQKTPVKTPDLLQSGAREVLTYAEAQKVVEFEVDSRAIRVSNSELITIYSKEDYEEKYGVPEQKEAKIPPKIEPVKQDEHRLPDPSFTVMENYNIPRAPPRPTNAYIRQGNNFFFDCLINFRR